MDLIDMLNQLTTDKTDAADGNAFGAHEAEREALAAMESQEHELREARGTMNEPEEFDAPAGDEEIGEAPAACDAPAAAGLVVPPEEAYRHKGMRYKLVFEGVCTHCAHCGQPLTDSTSVERGIGPVCSKKGYADETPVTDDTEALLALAEFPTLVAYLTEKYKPKGNRGLVNGLVRTASLNRRTPVHAACCDSVEALGYKRLAGALRESISIVEISDDKVHADSYSLWVKSSDFSWPFWNALKVLPGVFMERRPTRHTIVPKKLREELARLLLAHYEGLCVKTPKGAHKITPAWFARSRKESP
jgi:hypothetical protein